MKQTTARIELERGCDLEERRQFKKALEAYRKAAKRGSAEAQVNIANLYDDGKGCKRDEKKAVYWYKRATKSGSPEGAYNLGIHYRRKGNKRWAQYWFKRASDMGDEDARIEIHKST